MLTTTFGHFSRQVLPRQLLTSVVSPGWPRYVELTCRPSFRHNVSVSCSSMPKLYALGDIHLGHKLNIEEWEKVQPQAEDSLILAGDVGETTDHLTAAFRKAKACFKEVFWVPGNHELYTMPGDKSSSAELRGQDKYLHCVEIARQHDVLTPEDDWLLWEGDGGPAIIALCFTLYDYSFRPPDVDREDALEWAREKGIEATDEALLHYEPFSSRDEWCENLIQKFEKKFQFTQEKHPGVPFVIVNHWPLKEETIYIPLIPRFTLWCGTKATSDWHKTYDAKVVVTGHLHVRRTDWIDGVRFEETSLGYPRQWKDAKEAGAVVSDIMREILPGPTEEPSGIGKRTVWRRLG